MPKKRQNNLPADKGGEAVEVDAAANDKRLLQARQFLNQGEYEKSREKVTEYWLTRPFAPEAVTIYAEIARETGLKDLADKLDALGKRLTGSPHTPPYKHHQQLFDAAYALVDNRQYVLAVMLLKEMAKELPDDQHVHYELGFALLSLKRHEEAIKHFSVAGRNTEDFDAYLNLCVCHTLLRNVDAATKALDIAAPLAKNEEEKTEVEHRRIVLKRLKLVATKKEMSSRDWLFVLYGTILLRPTVKILDLKEEPSHIAAMVVMLKGLLTGLSIEQEGVEYYSLRSRPLSSVLGQLSGLPFDAYRGPDRPDRVLLTLTWTTDIIGPHQAFIPNSERRSIFAYALTPDQPLPLVPDIVGCLAQDVTMPWEGDKTPKELERLVENILERAFALEASPELIQEYQEAIDYYHDKRDLLVFTNHAAFPNRPEYTAEVPNLPYLPGLPGR
ncbi:MAG: tetratricopeptide repeat protein [Cyanobacteria bacterium SZAS LIN-3]|nr:tetratricopeptide repeat protein [Cyanobacteria bacterium SZAS LIN-3]